MFEAVLVVAAAAALTCFFLYPLPVQLGSIVYQPDSTDGRFSIWNVSWVARALLHDPRGVFDANIFYPERGTLLYSEANLGSGFLAIPVYWATANQFAAHGFVVLLSFVASAVATYYLLRHLVDDRLAASVGAIAFAFSPHLFAHLLHIQLLWTAGLPLGLLMYHRLVERPSAARGFALGAAVAAQTYLCAYYGVFLVLVIGLFTVWIVCSRRLWRQWALWAALTTAGATTVVTMLPLLVPFFEFRQSTGFARPLAASLLFSANWPAYLASAATAHGWLLSYLPRWNEVLFPGFVVVLFAALGVRSGYRAGGRLRDTTLMYTALLVLALWASFGPRAGLYRWLYYALPPMWLMRAPSRFGVVVLLAGAVVSAVGLTLWPIRRRAPVVFGGLVLAAVIGEHVVPLDYSPAPRPDPVYVRLAELPPGALLEMPVYSRRAQFKRTEYMLSSTSHWRPLVNAYSDFVPDSFQARLDVFGDFPSRDALRELSKDGVRYVIVHKNLFTPERVADLQTRLRDFEPYLRKLYEDDRAWINEIVGCPE